MHAGRGLCCTLVKCSSGASCLIVFWPCLDCLFTRQSLAMAWRHKPCWTLSESLRIGTDTVAVLTCALTARSRHSLCLCMLSVPRVYQSLQPRWLDHQMQSFVSLLADITTMYHVTPCEECLLYHRCRACFHVCLCVHASPLLQPSHCSNHYLCECTNIV